MPTLETIVEALKGAAVVTGAWAPLVIFLATFVEHVFPPFPGDLLVVLAAWYAVQGELSWAGLLLWSTLGAVAGAWVDHRVGAWLGRRLDLRSGRSRLLPPERLEAFEAAYRRWGSWLILFNRFMPGVRAFIFLAAGASGIPVRRVVLLGAVSAVAWNALLLLAGGVVARNLGELVGLVDQYMKVAGIVLLLAGLALAGRALWRRRARREP
jgi:membrane-associated protein